MMQKVVGVRRLQRDARLLLRDAVVAARRRRDLPHRRHRPLGRLPKRLVDERQLDLRHGVAVVRAAAAVTPTLLDFVDPVLDLIERDDRPRDADVRHRRRFVTLVQRRFRSLPLKPL